MKKLSLVLVLFIFMGIISSCTGKPIGGASTNSSENISNVLQEKGNVTSKDSSIPISQRNANVSRTFNDFGKVKNVYPIDAKTVLVDGDMLYLYQPDSKKVIAKAKSVEYTIYQCTAYNGGFLLAGYKMPTSGGSFQYFFEIFNKSLKKTQTIKLNELNQLGDPHITISQDGKKICFVSLSGMYLYDIASKKRTRLIDFSQNGVKKTGILIVTQPSFVNGGKNIAFAAVSSFVNNIMYKNSVTTCGVIGVDGKNLVIKKPTNLSIYEQIGSYDKYVLFAQDFRKPTGQVLKMSVPSGKLSYLKTKGTKESGCVYGSDNGSSYATAYPNGNNWVIGIYDTKTGKKLKEKIIACKDIVYTYRVPKIIMLDKEKTCIVLLGHSQENFKTSVSIIKY